MSGTNRQSTGISGVFSGKAKQSVYVGNRLPIEVITDLAALPDGRKVAATDQGCVYTKQGDDNKTLLVTGDGEPLTANNEAVVRWQREKYGDKLVFPALHFRFGQEPATELNGYTRGPDGIDAQIANAVKALEAQPQGTHPDLTATFAGNFNGDGGPASDIDPHNSGPNTPENV